MYYIIFLVIIHFLIENVLQSEKNIQLKTNNSDETFLHNIFVTIGIIGFYAGLKHPVDGALYVLLFFYLIMTLSVLDIIFLPIIDKYKKMGLSGTNIPNIGERTITQLLHTLRLILILIPFLYE